MAIRVDELADAIAEELRAYRQDVAEDLFESVEEAADTCVATLRATSPEATGSYKKGWRKKTAYESDSDIRLQVHNATDCQLTHLLEDGHANVDGGRTPAQPHIGPAADSAAQLLEKDVKIKVGMK